MCVAVCVALCDAVRAVVCQCHKSNQIERAREVLLYEALCVAISGTLCCSVLWCALVTQRVAVCCSVCYSVGYSAWCSVCVDVSV